MWWKNQVENLGQLYESDRIFIVPKTRGKYRFKAKINYYLTNLHKN